ncbi:daptide-type RiPP biosynthesis aminotransferase [Kitasatospora sp. NPDC093558]|uniref:daptide-type RiPP biosynthesis aminotransferase n=1 Tax=Kitasatospora sp. NPDC093558 TaxID=3155201 RepID=UPI00341EFA38
MTVLHDYLLWKLLLPPSDCGGRNRRKAEAVGARLRFADGSEVLDATSGLWNVNLGYGNAAIGEAIAAAERADPDAGSSSHSYALKASESLVAAAGQADYRQAVFSTSGGAANDLAMKLARQYAALRGQKERRLVVALKGRYHGLTYGVHSLTREALDQQLYGVDLRNVRHVDPADPEELVRFMERHGPRVAAVACEPVLGSGAHPLSDAFVGAMTTLRHEYGFLLIADEVATGFGRTGPMFASSRWPEAPDLLIASKGLTNGSCAASAVLVSHVVAAAFEEHDAPLVPSEAPACSPANYAAISATLAQFEELDALAAAERTGTALHLILREVTRRRPLVRSITGTGCFRALHLQDADGRPLDDRAVQGAIAAIRSHGALVYPGPGAIQLVPVLTSTKQDLADLASALRQGLDETGLRAGHR